MQAYADLRVRKDLLWEKSDRLNIFLCEIFLTSCLNVRFQTETTPRYLGWMWGKQFFSINQNRATDLIPVTSAKKEN